MVVAESIPDKRCVLFRNAISFTVGDLVANNRAWGTTASGSGSVSDDSGGPISQVESALGLDSDSGSWAGADSSTV